MGALYPTSATLRPVNPILSDALIHWSNSQSDYIADKVLRPIRTTEKTGTIITVGRNATFGDSSDSLVRAPRSGYSRAAGNRLASTTYSAMEYGRETIVDLQMIADAQDPIKLKELESYSALADILVARERRVASLLFNTSTFTTTTLAGPTQWTAATGDPITSIENACNAVQDRVGMKPNAIVLGLAAVRAMRKSAAVLSFMATDKDRLMVTEPGLRSMLQTVFGFNLIEFGSVLYNTANQAATVSLSPVWGDYVWVGVLSHDGVQSGRSDMAVRPTAAAAFAQVELESEEYDSNEARSVVIRHREIRDEVVIDSAAGQIIEDTAA